MKAIAQQVWNEPAVAVGLLVTILLLIGAFLTDSDFSWEAIVAICAPFVSSLGIRPLVTPVKHDVPPADPVDRVVVAP